ncbi:FMN-binding negative transcriptional regulator [Humitalea sp. 24SJ18S-53]|uniref:FMN-binding negative transcriptional regulator n=1 Tax=Humitalea sp. 24SJ18S-53 TaxID=3422307 RepID=UPI003D66BF1E
MYNPPAFRIDDADELASLITQARLALLVCNGADGIPAASHLPLILDRADKVLHGHLARANPQWQALAAAGRALAVFSGPDAYVSPSLYPSKAEHGRVVPTWNYVAVHAHCDVEVYDDADRLHAVVSRLTDLHESPRQKPWAVDDAPKPFVAGQLKGIVGLRLTITALIGKKKLSQNRAAPDRDGVAAGLADSADPRDQAVAQAMRG